jgi:hypothetical protein
MTSADSERPNSSAHDVFISYSSQDKTVALAVCGRLEERGIRCWIAPRDADGGQRYGASIVDAIRGSRVVVLVLSSHANSSPFIPNEIERAASFGIPILPLRIEDVLPDKSMELFIGAVHWLDAIPPDEQHLQRLGDSVLRLLNHPAAPPREAARPPDRTRRDAIIGGQTTIAPPPGRGSHVMAAGIAVALIAGAAALGGMWFARSDPTPRAFTTPGAVDVPTAPQADNATEVKQRSGASKVPASRYPGTWYLRADASTGVVDPQLVGVWEFSVPPVMQLGTRWIWEVHAEGAYVFRAEGFGAPPSHNGAITARGGRWTQRSSNGLVNDAGTYAFLAPGRVQMSSPVGTGAWTRIRTLPNASTGPPCTLENLAGEYRFSDGCPPPIQEMTGSLGTGVWEKR